MPLALQGGTCVRAHMHVCACASARCMCECVRVCSVSRRACLQQHCQTGSRRGKRCGRPARGQAVLKPAKQNRSPTPTPHMRGVGRALAPLGANNPGLSYVYISRPLGRFRPWQPPSKTCVTARTRARAACLPGRQELQSIVRMHPVGWVGAAMRLCTAHCGGCAKVRAAAPAVS